MKFKNNKGITLIILIVTIIVLLIISGITISTITGGEGTVDKANQAKNETEIQAEMEELQKIINQSAAKGIRHGNYSGSADAQTIREALKKNNLIKENPDDVIIDGKSEWIITGSKTGTFYSIHFDGNVERLKGIITEFKASNNETVNALSLTENVKICDINKKPVIIPAGFGIACDSGTTIEEGIVIEDAFSTDAKKGSQFVWVPVNTEVTYNSNYVNSAQQSSLANADSSIETIGATSGIIKLSRYNFGTRTNATSVSTLIPKKAQDEILGYNNRFFAENITGFTGTKGEYQASMARKDSSGEIEFLNKTNNAKGFYIGRYEMGNNNNIAVCKAGETAWTDIVRGNVIVTNNTTNITGAVKESRNMYGYQEGKYTSDLINSFAWDTTLAFIEKCGTNNNYAFQTSLQSQKTTTGNATDGTNKDVQCNIYDLAGNVREWTTESSYSTDYPCADRGGSFYYNSVYYTCARYRNSTSSAENWLGFRPILYIL